MADSRFAVVEHRKLEVFLRLHRQQLGIFFVVEAQFVKTFFTFGLNARLGLIRRKCVRQGIRAVVHTAGNERLIRVAIDKAHHHFLADARDKLRAEAVAAPGGGDPQPAGAGFVVFALSVPRELHLHPTKLISPDFFSAFTHHHRCLRMHKRLRRHGERTVRRGLRDGGKAVAIALAVVFVADGDDQPVDVQCFVIVIGQSKPVPGGQRRAVAFADQLFRLRLQGVNFPRRQRVAFGFNAKTPRMLILHTTLLLTSLREQRRFRLLVVIVAALEALRGGLQTQLCRANRPGFPLAALCRLILDLFLTRYRREGAVIIRQHQRVFAFLMGEEPEDPLQLQQPRDKIKIAFVVLQAVFALF